LLDCAPLVLAHELGFFEKHGVEVELRREVGWATIRDKIIHGELHAAQSVAALPFALTLGLGSASCECLTGLVISSQGSSVTLSKRLWDRGVRDEKTLREEIGNSKEKTLAFGAVFPLASSNFLLRQWFDSAGIDPDRDVHIVTVPHSQMFRHLKTGHLDGYCSSEPWNSAALHAGLGWCPISGAELSPGHPETVLLVRNDFAEKNHETHLSIIAAVIEACAYCSRPSNQEHVADTLSKYINVSANSLRRILTGPMEPMESEMGLRPSLPVFHSEDANEPSEGDAAWILRQLPKVGPITDQNPWVVRHLTEGATHRDLTSLQSQAAQKIFRADIFHQARQLVTNYENEHESESTLRIS
jgi:ABC-type nitrate/sulfonate/bicarbonate transport system substrate-binding protein